MKISVGDKVTIKSEKALVLLRGDKGERPFGLLNDMIREAGKTFTVESFDPDTGAIRFVEKCWTWHEIYLENVSKDCNDVVFNRLMEKI